MFDKYIDYDGVVCKLITQHEDHMAALQSLTEQYAEILEDDGVNAIQYDRASAKTNKIDDHLLNRIIQKEAVKNRLEELEKEQRVFNMAWDRLTPDEKTVLETFFMRGMRKQDVVDILCESLHCESATVYRKKDAALKRFKCLLFG